MVYISLLTILENAATHLGASAGDIGIIVLAIGCLIFFAVSVRLALLISMVLFAGLYVAYYLIGWSTEKVLIILILIIIFMAFTLMISGKKEGGLY